MIAKPVKHFNDWPNSQGFDTSYEERSPVELKVDGTIPSYVAGTLFRPGPGPRTIDMNNGGTYKVSHWFDYLTQVHRFQISQGEDGTKVTYNSRLVTDGLVEKVKKNGKLDGFTFAKKYDPCKTFFSKLQAVFNAQTDLNPNEANVGVTISKNFPGLSREGKPKKGGYDDAKTSTIVMKTDAPHLQSLDPETLEPVGVASQTVLNPDLKGAGSAAHAEHDPVTGDIFNYNLDFGRTGTYRIWRASASTGKTSILATIPHTPAYLHSLFLTENYVILCVWNSFYKAGGASILWTKNLLDAMKYDSTKPATWFVIDKNPSGKGLVATYESDAFFCFHTINAYEETSSNGTTSIIADLAAYQDMRVLDKFYYDNLISDSPNATKWSSDDSMRPTYRQYKLASIPSTPDKNRRKAELLFKSSVIDTPELPTFAPSVSTKKHRYVYGINDSGKSTLADSLIKYDLESHTTIRWSKHGHTGGEAIFVPDPEGTGEDDGMLLTVVLDGIEGKSYLLVLNAKDMSEVAKAHVDGVVGMGFHGLYVGQPAVVPNGKVEGGSGRNGGKL